MKKKQEDQKSLNVKIFRFAGLKYHRFGYIQISQKPWRAC